ncbi:MAG: HD-GYP domain-containing protein [Oscillospiraceae bacterium]|nr:HD-GYP domain-containing protein [Oscillospiraceae bacterium]
MRYIKTEHLKEGMALGIPFYGLAFEVLKDAGEVLSAQDLEVLDELGYAGVYVDDALSKGIEPDDIIPHDMRINAVRATRDFFAEAELRAKKGGGAPAKDTRDKQMDIIMPIIDALLKNQNRIVDVIDLKSFDYYKYYHAVNVAVLSILIGIESGLGRVQLYELGTASLLHDVGNIFIPKSILNKRGKLTKEEFEIIKSHSQIGFEYLRENFDISIEACMGALQHHERYNGTGYPGKLKRDGISLYGRIIAIAEVYDALTSKRPFRSQSSPSFSMNYMDENAGLLFDPDVFEVFSGLVSLYPSGTCVELDDGTRCITAGNSPGDTATPRLRKLGDLSITIDLQDGEEDERIIAGIIDI